MKMLVIVDYDGDAAAIDALAGEHHRYFARFLADGTLFAAGRRAESGGAVWIVEVDSPDQVAAMIAGDPFHTAGIITGWHTHPLTNWSAKDYKGS